MLINKYGNYLRKEFGQPIYKITVDAGFTCPNRDGTKGIGGCTYCNNEKFFQVEKYQGKPPRDQVLEKISKRNSKKNEKHIVYFQTYSNTYGNLEHLKEVYSSVLEIENVVGLAIGTRVDCMSEEVFELLSEISKKYYVCLEYGLESIYDSTLEKINRGHDLNCFIKTVNQTKQYGIDVCAHLILGFPWENRSVAKESALFINDLPIKFVKIHQLQVVKNSMMGRDYQKKPFPLLDKDTYIEYLSDFITHLSPECIIQRVAGDCPEDIILGTGFSENSHRILFELENKLTSAGLKQGIYHRGSHEIS